MMNERNVSAGKDMTAGEETQGGQYRWYDGVVSAQVRGNCPRGGHELIPDEVEVGCGCGHTPSRSTRLDGWWMSTGFGVTVSEWYRIWIHVQFWALEEKQHLSNHISSTRPAGFVT
jgi:hypothetical protein